MEQPSILEKVVLEPILLTARQNFVRDGFLIPILLLQLETLPPKLVPLNLPSTSEQKQRYFTQIGAQLDRAGQVLQAAVMLFESWYVNAQAAPAATRFLPSQHPCRQEAIILMGRNAEHSRVTLLIQPFVRNRDNQPVWGSPPFADYNESVKKASKSSGLLDYLFLANRR